MDGRPENHVHSGGGQLKQISMVKALSDNMVLTGMLAVSLSIEPPLLPPNSGTILVTIRQQMKTTEKQLHPPQIERDEFPCSLDELLDRHRNFAKSLQAFWKAVSPSGIICKDISLGAGRRRNSSEIQKESATGRGGRTAAVQDAFGGSSESKQIMLPALHKDALFLMKDHGRVA